MLFGFYKKSPTVSTDENVRVTLGENKRFVYIISSFARRVKQNFKTLGKEDIDLPFVRWTWYSI